MVDAITNALGFTLYNLFWVIFLFIDTLQKIFFAFAGIKSGSESWELADTEASDNILYYLLNRPLVKNMLISIMVLAIFLLIIFTVMAFIKNAYTSKPKTWQEIIVNALKGLANFIFLPVCCLLGVFVGNILLQAINGATTTNGSTDLSRKLFIACAYNANRYRTSSENDNGQRVRDIINQHVVQEYKTTIVVEEGRDNEYYAQLVDEIYGNSKYGVDIWTKIDVGMGYNLWEFNYLMQLVGGIFILYVLGALAFAMVRRLILLIILFIISPAMCAMYPIDDGKAVGAWSGEVKKNILSAYGAVAGLNLYFSIIPLLDSIKVWGGVSGYFADDIVKLFVMVCGLFCVKELISTISSLVGGDDAYSKGSGLMKSSTDKVKGQLKKTGKFIGAGYYITRGKDNTGNAFGRMVNVATGGWYGNYRGRVDSYDKDTIEKTTELSKEEKAKANRRVKDASSLTWSDRMRRYREEQAKQVTKHNKAENRKARASAIGGSIGDMAGSAYEKAYGESIDAYGKKLQAKYDTRVSKESAKEAMGETNSYLKRILSELSGQSLEKSSKDPRVKASMDLMKTMGVQDIAARFAGVNMTALGTDKDITKNLNDSYKQMQIIQKQREQLESDAVGVNSSFGGLSLKQISEKTGMNEEERTFIQQARQLLAEQTKAVDDYNKAVSEARVTGSEDLKPYLDKLATIASTAKSQEESLTDTTLKALVDAMKDNTAEMKKVNTAKDIRVGQAYAANEKTIQAEAKRNKK